jgi:hypothetical protein
MSYHDGMAAINLQFSDRVPRTEYSAEFHWDLITKVTGVCVNGDSPPEIKREASKKFRLAWNYDLNWSTLIGNSHLRGPRTSMGHAVYQANASDFNTNIYEAFTDTEDVFNIDMFGLYGTLNHADLVKDFNNHYAGSKAALPEEVNMTGVYITCISGLISILGWEMLLTALGEDPVRFGEFTNRYCDWIKQYFDALADCDSDIIMIHDDIVWTEGPFASPAWYRKYVIANYKRLFAPMVEAGKKILYTSDGTYTEFIGDLADVGVHGFVLEPTTNMKYIADKYGGDHVFIGNADTRVLLLGSRDDIYNEVKRCMDIGKKHPGFFMAVGNHIPPNTPVDNCLWYNEFYEKLSKR